MIIKSERHKELLLSLIDNSTFRGNAIVEIYELRAEIMSAKVITSDEDAADKARLHLVEHDS